MYCIAHRIITVSVCLFLALQLSAQNNSGKNDIYGERKDSLNATVFTARQKGQFLPKGKDVKVEVISSAGLAKMACCSLADSFENSASVTVGYSDAVTGARQIRLLGQSGIYTQMLDASRPVMRGLSAPFGLNFVPGQWLESIQISKGVSSVVSGVESMTGQINLEHRKPTDEIPLFIQASTMNDLKTDFNIASSLQLNDKWSTILLGHVDFNQIPMDHNGDGFMDDPRSRTVTVANRWLYFDPNGIQIRFGVKGVDDRRQGGQMADMANPWQSDVTNRSLDAYYKMGISLREDNTSNVAMVVNYTYQDLGGTMGYNSYTGRQNSLAFNLLWLNEVNENHKFTVGFNDVYDHYQESLNSRVPLKSPLEFYLTAYPNQRIATPAINDAAVFGEYTYHVGDKFSTIAGVRADWYNTEGVKVSPRLTLRYMPHESIVLRANAGRGIRASVPVVDNIGMLSTTKYLQFDIGNHMLEDSWAFGANATYYLPFWSAYVSVDYFHTQFVEQLVYENNADYIHLYSLSSFGGKSYTDNIQLDISFEPVERLTFNLTGRYTDARQSYLNMSNPVLKEKPMVSRYKGVFNAQYATRLSKWIFDFTASVTGPCKVWDFMEPDYKDGLTEAYPLLYAQVTRRFKGFDVYLGGENLTGYRQTSPIIGASNPWQHGFDASCVWGPIMGTKVYLGFRFTLWKTN